MQTVPSFWKNILFNSIIKANDPSEQAPGDHHFFCCYSNLRDLDLITTPSVTIAPAITSAITEVLSPVSGLGYLGGSKGVGSSSRMVSVSL